VVAEAGDDVIEALSSRREIDQRGEYGRILVEKELHPLQGSQYCVLEKSHLSSGSDGLTREMKAATVRVCAVAEGGEAVRWQRVGVAVRLLRVIGGGRALRDTVIGIVGME
jgi:hypothetical protein